MKSYLRMSVFGLVAGIALGLVGYFASAQLPVYLHKIALVTVAAYVGYWIDRHAFPYGRPHNHGGTPGVFVGCMIRRALIMLGTMLTMGMGL